MTATAKTKCCERLTPSDTETLNVVVLNTEPKMSVVFFFQAEDGIRGWSVTGVQTCALPISLPGLAQLTGLVGHELERLVPRHRLQRVAVTPLRAGETVRVIDLLQRRLAAHAERALIDRMVGIPLELHDAAVAVAREHAAAGWALTAHGREIRRDAGHDLLVRHHERQDPLGRLLAAGHGCGGARRRDDLEEVASFHLNGAPARLESWVRVIGRRGCARRKWRATYAGLRPQNAASDG